MGTQSLVSLTPTPSCRELGAVLQAVFPFQQEQVGSLEPERGPGGGGGAWQASLAGAAAQEGVFLRLPSLPSPLLPGSPILKVPRPSYLHLRSVCSGERGFNKLIFTKV